MSVGFIGSKHTVYDAYPIRSKRILLLVDPQNVTGETTDFFSTMATINYLIAKQAAVVVASSFGHLAGASLNLSKRERENSLEVFQLEKGMGYTQFFSTLPPAKKLEIIRSISGVLPEHKSSDSIAGSNNSSTRGNSSVKEEPKSGKTFLFASLPTTQKAAVLRKFFPKREFFSSTTAPFVDALRASFPQSKVSFATDCLRAPVEQILPGDILVLENLQFYRNETSHDPQERAAMAEVLVAGIDIFINDSFATAHSVHASSIEVPKLMQHGAAGHSMDRELAFYSKFLSHPTRPLVVAVGGINIPGKLRLLHSLVGRVDRILVGGPVAFPFLVAKGLSCGRGYAVGPDELTMTRNGEKIDGSGAMGGDPTSKSGGGAGASASGGATGNTGNAGTASGAPTERRRSVQRAAEVPCSVYAREIMAMCEANDVQIVLPIDHVVVKEFSADKSTSVLVESTAISDDVYAMDVGVHTINLFNRALRDCRALFWAGTFGWLSKGYGDGTNMFASMLGTTDIISIVGGRNTARAVQEMGVANKILHVSSGGLSCLEVLLGNPLPGIEALSDVAPVTDSSMTLSVHELLRHLPLFVGCNSHQMKVAAKKFVRRVHGRGDYLICRGDHHVRLWVVAQGGLVAKYGADYSSVPARYIPRGQAVGMYDFVTQATSVETVRAAHEETVTYHITTSALNEILNAHPDIAAQLFQNISVPLRLMANSEYRAQQTVLQTTIRNGCHTRIPTLFNVPTSALSSGGFWIDLAHDIISTLTLQRLTMQYAPYVALTYFAYGEEAEPLDPGVVGTAGFALQRHRGLPYAVGVSVARCAMYHQLVALSHRPWFASVVSTVVCTPLRVLSYGIAYNDMNFKIMLDEALIGAAVCTAPLVAYAGSLALQRKVEDLRKRRLGRMGQLLITGLVKLLLGLTVFPIIFQRNYLYTQPSASRFWDVEAFRAYELKQCASLGIRFVVSMIVKLTSSR